MKIKSTLLAKCFSLSAIIGTFLITAPSVSATNELMKNVPVSNHKAVVNSRVSHVNSSANFMASRLPVLTKTINLVKQYEGFKAQAYIDTSGLPVIGYGQSRINGKPVRIGQYITKAQADAALQRELYHIQQLVLAHVKVDLNPYQY